MTCNILTELYKIFLQKCDINYDCDCGETRRITGECYYKYTLTSNDSKGFEMLLTDLELIKQIKQMPTEFQENIYKQIEAHKIMNKLVDGK